ncbi:hypothetical protein DICPUDRAFT_150327 [Dictyostelium purpureum]|uniref:Gamma-secretase-activating protein C-terminal domain-containing protein n=1 Tax=Dictyostelium purpureum TaxID=5786 RepID=F0ZG18_DICPU|nr:uncharacterized protein DICPUDRAFT_150327 [Dictyostelium purpureum]EGC37104.1 hypothetical protein DICPUDRAFT_150327 [Dictyostelium purpureum]|eukprot:XP_003286385.1 hypothetical protein DICPUDRAFT_150327 [Dictyostelium purpureum]
MFKFRKLFSLEHDVVPKIPSTQLPTASEATSFRPIIFKNSQPVELMGNSSSAHSPTPSISSSFGGFSSPSHNNNNNNNNNSNHQKNNSGNYVASSSFTNTNPLGIPVNPLKLNNSSLPNNDFKLGTSLNNSQYDLDGESNTSSTSPDGEDKTDNLNKIYQQINYSQSINLRIIGRDKGVILILARNSKNNGTYIDFFDISKHEYTTILEHPGNVVSASLSADANRSFLVFTVKSINPKTQKDSYSSFIFETLNKKQPQNFIPLEIDSENPLVYHFLAGFHEKQHCTLLLFQNDECHSVKIQLKTEDNSSNHHHNHYPYQSIATNKKTTKSLIFKRCYWYQFDYHSQILYSLHLKQKSNSTFSASSIGGVGNSNNSNNSGTQESLLKIWALTGPKIINTHDGIPLHLNVSLERKMSSNFPFPLGVGKYAPYEEQQVYQNIHIVRLPTVGLCLCHQEESSKPTLSIKISIYLLHLKQKIRYSIPLNTMDDGWSAVSKTRVLFDNFGSLLMVYVPGYFFQFIDCAHDHDPSFGITLYSKDLSTPLAGMNHSQDSSDIVSVRSPPLPNKISQSVIPFYFLNGNISGEKPEKSASSSSGNGNTHDKSSTKNSRFLFDYTNGILYHYQFDRESIRKLFEVGMDPGTDIQAIHLAIIHMNDVELGSSIITHAAKNNLITTDLLKEYILASTYHTLKNTQLENAIGNVSYLDSFYLQALPISCAESIDIHTTNRKLKDLEVTPINTNIPNNLLLKEENRKRLRSFEVTKNEIMNKDGPSFSGFWRNFFGIDDDFVVVDPMKKDIGKPSGIMSNGSKFLSDPNLFENYQEDPLRDLPHYISTLTEFLHSVSQKENKERLNDWANCFRHIQINVVNNLYKTIKICYGFHHNNSPTNQMATQQQSNTIGEMKHSTRLILFQVMEKLYSAIEELYCPFPKDFYTQFTTLGFYCLQRPIFLQFLQKGIFVITGQFVKVLFKEFPTKENLTEEQRNFINQIVLQLRDQESVIELLSADLVNTNIIVEHLISLATQNIHPKASLDPNTDQIAEYQDTKFIPLYFLQDFLRSLALHTPSYVNLSNSTSAQQLLANQPPTPQSPNGKFHTPPTSPIRISNNGNNNQSMSSSYQPFSCSPVINNPHHLSSSSGNLSTSLSGANLGTSLNGSIIVNSNGSGNSNVNTNITSSNNPIYLNRNHIQRAYNFLDNNSDKILDQLFSNI